MGLACGADHFILSCAEQLSVQLKLFDESLLVEALVYDIAVLLNQLMLVQLV